MKTQYSRRTSVLSAQKSLALGVLVAVLVLLFILRTFFPTALSFIVSPLWNIGSMVTGTVAGISDSADVREERDALRIERDALSSENVTLQSRLAEIVDMPTGRGVLAQVRARPPLSPYDVLIVDEGTQAGVVVGAMVYAQGGVPIGTIRDVGKTQSRVMLYSSSKTETLGWAGEQRYPVTFVGESAGAFTASVPRDAEVAIGDIVYLPGPGAVAFGHIENTHGDASSPQTTLSIRPYINPFSLTSVVIETGTP